MDQSLHYTYINSIVTSWHVQHSPTNPLMKITYLIAASMLSLVSGCATTIELAKLQSGSAVAVTDSRPMAERVYRRDSVVSPIMYFGDEDFSSPPLAHFSALLGAKLPAGNYSLEVNQFRIIDFFPKRLNAVAIGQGSYVSEEFMRLEDNVTCKIAGNAHGKPFSASISIPYRVSPLAGLIKNDASFKGAVNECLGQLAGTVAKGM